MKKCRIIFFLIVTSLIFIIISSQVSAKVRSIFVGDLIELKVTTQEFTQNQLRDKFKDFEIVDVKEDESGYVITLRSFETGEKIVKLGDKEIVINIKSTLEDMDTNEVLDGNLSPEKAGFFIKWQYVFYALVVVFILSGGINLARYIKKRRTTLLSPYQNLIRNINTISLDNHDCFVKMTQYFKEYLESKFSCCIRGKTSSEVIHEISCIFELQALLPIIKEWLKESDYYKFAGITVSHERKQMLMKDIKELVRQIEEIKEGEI